MRDLWIHIAMVVLAIVLVTLVVSSVMTLGRPREDVFQSISFKRSHGACWAVYAGLDRAGLSLVPDRFCE